MGFRFRKSVKIAPGVMGGSSRAGSISGGSGVLTPASERPTSPKSKGIALILCIFLGVVGGFYDCNGYVLRSAGAAETDAVDPMGEGGAEQ